MSTDRHRGLPGGCQGAAAHAQPAQKSAGPCVWGHSSLGSVALRGTGPVAVPKGRGRAGSPRKVALFEMWYGYDLNLQSLSSWQDVWHWPGECGAGIGAGCSFSKESDSLGK